MYLNSAGTGSGMQFSRVNGLGSLVKKKEVLEEHLLELATWNET